MPRKIPSRPKPSPNQHRLDEKKLRTLRKRHEPPVRQMKYGSVAPNLISGSPVWEGQRTHPGSYPEIKTGLPGTPSELFC